MPGPRGGKGGMGRPMQKPQNVGKTIKRIINYLTEYKGLLVAVVFCILFLSVALIVGIGLFRLVLLVFLIVVCYCP